MFAMTLASEVFPDPGGPHKMRLVRRSVSIARRRSAPSPTMCPWPTNSSSDPGRMRSARGARGPGSAAIGATGCEGGDALRGSAAALAGLFRGLSCAFPCALSRAFPRAFVAGRFRAFFFAFFLVLSFPAMAAFCALDGAASRMFGLRDETPVREESPESPRGRS